MGKGAAPEAAPEPSMNLEEATAAMLSAVCNTPLRCRFVVGGIFGSFVRLSGLVASKHTRRMLR